MPTDPRTIATVSKEEIERIRAQYLAEQEWRLKTLPPRDCPVCEATFRPRVRWQKFCCGKCAGQWHGIRRARQQRGDPLVL